MDQRASEPLVLPADALVERLGKLLGASPGALLAFDGDGTLWSGDVGEDVFNAAIAGNLLRAEALAALQREASAHGIEAHGDANQIAERLFQAYLEHRYPERDACAMMTWCYAGMTRRELAELAVHTFEARGLSRRRHHELMPIFEFARAHGLRTVVVSASPQPIVEAAAATWEITPSDIAASRAAEQGGTLLAHLAWPVPYADGKPVALHSLAPGTPVLAAFGDNVFDLELFHASTQPVAVRPKPALRRRFVDVPGLCVLAHDALT